MDTYYLGIDIGGTKIKTVVLNEQGIILEQNEVLTEDASPEKELWKKKIITIIKEKHEQYANSNSKTLKCGISAPGLVDSKNKMTLHMPERLQGIENFDWSSELQRNISVINDGHSACLAEYESFYRSKGIQHLVMLTLGTGVGGGIIINGQLYQGNLQRAGHVGHMTVDLNGAPTMTNMPGSLEYAVGNFSVFERTEGQFNTVRELVNAIDFASAVCETDVIGIDDLPDFPDRIQSLSTIEPEISEEAIILNNALDAHRWNITATARFLGVDRTTVHRKMKRLGLVTPNNRKA